VKDNYQLVIISQLSKL